MRIRPMLTSFGICWKRAGLFGFVWAYAACPGIGQTASLSHAGGQTLSENDSTITALLASARTSLREQRYDNAMEQFEAVLKAVPGSEGARRGEADAAIGWALVELQQQHTDTAMEILVRGIRQVPDDPELLTDFGVEATALGQFPIAEQSLRTADKVRPNNAKTVYGLARLDLERQHMPEAEKELKAYLELKPQDASAYFGLGHLYAMQQRPDEARAAFERSVQLQPTQTESYYQLGQLDLDAHKDPEAEREYGKVLERMPQHAGALTGLGEIALRAKEYAKAEQYLAKAEKSDPNYQTPHYFRGLALAKLGRQDEAKQELARGDSRQHATAPEGAGTPK